MPLSHTNLIIVLSNRIANCVPRLQIILPNNKHDELQVHLTPFVTF